MGNEERISTIVLHLALNGQRNTAEDTAGNHGLGVPAARSMFYQAGFTQLALSGGKRVPLIAEYIESKLAGK